MERCKELLLACCLVAILSTTCLVGMEEWLTRDCPNIPVLFATLDACERSGIVGAEVDKKVQEALHKAAEERNAKEKSSPVVIRIPTHMMRSYVHQDDDTPPSPTCRVEATREGVLSAKALFWTFA